MTSSHHVDREVHGIQYMHVKHALQTWEGLWPMSRW